MPSDSTPATVRLNKFLAQSGVASRRKADALIASGKVLVNGRRVTELGAKVHPHNDKVTVRGRPVRQATQFHYFMFNKPSQVLTTLGDSEGRPSIKDYVRHLKYRVYPVGRLEWDSEGLILLTNDGELAQQINNPKSKIPITYAVKLKGNTKPENLKRLTRGVTVGGKAKAISVDPLGRKGEGKYDWVEITIDEGRNLQLRRMLEKIGCDIIKLQCVAIGRLQLGKLKKGTMRELTAIELDKIFLE